MDLKQLKHKKIAVLMGGFSSEREISLRSGKNVTRILQEGGYNAFSLDVREDFIEKIRENKVELAFNVLHGFFGEDGRVQAILEYLGIPYTGSGVEASAIAMNKILSKQIVSLFGIQTAPFFLIREKKDFDKINFDMPWIIKPLSEGSSINVKIIKNKNDIPDWDYAKNHFFVEKFISGREVTVGVLNDKVLPVLELVPKKEFYDFEAKYTKGMTEFILPASLEKDLYEAVQSVALKAHQSIGCAGATRSDFIIDKKGEIYFLEINTNPGMTDTSDIPAQARAMGMSDLELCEAILLSCFAEKK